MSIPPRVAEGLVGAAVGSVVSAAPSTMYAFATSRSVLEATEAAGTLLVPADWPRPARVVAGGVAHAAISVGWGVAFSLLLPLSGRTRRDALRGAGAGLAVAALDLGVVGRRFPAIRALPVVPQLADHAAYGASVAAVVSVLRRRRTGGRRGRRG